VIKSSTSAGISEFVGELFDDESPQKNRYPTLALLVNDQFGNYVLQTLLNSSSGEFRKKILYSLSTCRQLKMDYGNNLLQMVDQMICRETSNIKEKEIPVSKQP